MCIERFKNPTYVAYDIYGILHTHTICICMHTIHTHKQCRHGPAWLYIDTFGRNFWREGKEKSSCSPDLQAWPLQALGELLLGDLVEQKIFLSVGSTVVEHSSRHFQPFHTLR